MATIREVLYQNTKKVSSRNIAKAFNMSNTTIKKYIKLAKAHGYTDSITDDQLEAITLKVEKNLYAKPSNNKALAMMALIPYKDTIQDWLKEPNMTHTLHFL